MAELLNAEPESSLTAFGYMHWLLRTKGASAIMTSTMNSAKNVHAFAEATENELEVFPALLLTASRYMAEVVDKVGSLSDALPILDGMCDPVCLYLLLHSIVPKEVQQYEKQTRERFGIYPGIVGKLPEEFRKVAEDLLKQES